MKLFLIILVLLIGLLRPFFRSALFKGWSGEVRIRLMTRLFLDRKHYQAFHDVTLPAHDGTTQIDHVIVSPYGIFVIETKNMGGAIYGSAIDATWTQKIGGQTHKFQNPLRQNYKHTKTLAEVLMVPSEQIHSVVVFVGGGKLKKEPPRGVTVNAEYLAYIRSFRSPLIGPDRVLEICQLLQAKRLPPGLKTHRKHVAHVRGIKDSRSTVPEPSALSPSGHEQAES